MLTESWHLANMMLINIDQTINPYLQSHAQWNSRESTSKDGALMTTNSGCLKNKVVTSNLTKNMMEGKKNPHIRNSGFKRYLEWPLILLQLIDRFRLPRM